MEVAVKIDNLVKRYPDFTLDHVSMEIPKGSIVGLIGANGAGKTTLIKSILGIINKDEGRIFINGKEITDKDHAWKDKVGMVLAETTFHETMNAHQIGNIMKKVFRKWDAVRYHELLKSFQINEKKVIKEYSRGMKMKIQIAVALSHGAELLIFDEATSGLDPVVRDDLLDILLEFMQDENHTVLLSSHITTDLEKVSDYIAFIHKGKMYFMKEKDVILDNYGIAKCSKEQFAYADKSLGEYVRTMGFGTEMLVRDRYGFKEAYPEIAVDAAGIEDVMLFVEKGEKL